MVLECVVCGKEFGKVNDKIILCKFKNGIVHQECCIKHCSVDGKPCRHSMGIFRRSKFKEEDFWNKKEKRLN
ncbi:hypothetical protein KKG83_02855 [Candidatus Micrarchaeota archaeon]|nr:hypothetical protein [Candidatus Micrarchaeota archaeon]MBU2476385.1 hypothetical protein [Candidatus Micrarchaeota archaeon]